MEALEGATTASCATSRAWPSGARAPASRAARRPWTCSASAVPSTCPGAGPGTRPAPAPTGARRERIERFERHLRRGSSAPRSPAPGSCRPPGRCASWTALPTGPAADLAEVHRVVAPKRRLATQGQEQRGHRRPGAVDVRRTVRASLETGGVPLRLRHRPRRPRRPELYVLCDVSTSVTSASVFFLSVLPPFTTRSGGCAPSSSWSVSPRSPTCSRASAPSRPSRKRSPRRRAWRTSRATRTTGGSGSSCSGGGRGPRPALAARARRRADERARPARRGLRHGVGPRGRVVDQPRAAPLLELRRLGDGRLRAVVRRRLRVLVVAPARGGGGGTGRSAAR